MADHDPPDAQPGRRILAAAALAAAALLAYANTLGVPFLLDDNLSVTDNTAIRSLRHLGRVLAPDSLNMVGRPVLDLSLALNYAWSGTRPWSYHLANAGIHLLAGLALFGLAWRTLRSAPCRERFGRAAVPLGAAIAAIWTLHPLQTEAVTYVTERAESLMGLFYLLTLYCFARAALGEGEGRAAPPGVWLGLSVLCCFLGVGTKEVMVTAPVVVLLYDRAFASASFRAALRRRLYYGGLAASWLALAFLLAGPGWRGRTIGFHAGVGEARYILTEGKAVLLYLKLAFWPHPLVFDYGGPEALLGGVGWWPCLLLIAAALAAAAWAWRRSRPAGFLGLSFFLLLAPSSSVVPLALQPIAEHRMYLALAPLTAGVAAAAWSWAGRRSLLVLFAIAAVFGVLTCRRNQDYRSALALWSDTVAKRPQSARAELNLATELERLPGGAEAALARAREALRLRPDFPEAHYDLAVMLERQPGGSAEAIAQYREALRFKPGYAEARYNLANALARTPGGLPEAVAQYRILLAADPGRADARYNLANALVRLSGHGEEAIAQYQAALRLRPDFAQAENNLANELARTPGRSAEAIAHYRRALELDPDNLEAHFNLATQLARAPGGSEEAARHFREALRLDPNLAQAHFNLAVLDFRAGRRGDAAAELEACLRLDPSDQRASAALARLRAVPPVSGGSGPPAR